MAFRIKNPFGQKAVDKSSPELMEREASGDDGPAEVVQYNESDFERNTESNVADRVGGGDVDGDGAADRVTVRGWDPEKKEERSVASGSEERADEESPGIAIGDPGVNGNLAAAGNDGTPGALASSFNSSKSGVYRTSGDDETDIDRDPADAQKNWLPSNFRREASDPTDDNTDADDLPNAAYDVKAPRDVATGQASGRMASTEGRPTYDVKSASKREGVPTDPTDDDTDADSSAEGGTSYRESPTRASLGRREDVPGDPSTGDTPDPEAVSLNGLPPGVPVEDPIPDVPETTWPSDDRISTNMTIERQTPKRDFGDRQMEEGGGEEDPNAVYDVKAPRDIATGQSSGREGGPRQTTSQDGIAVNEEGSSNIGSSAQENGTLDFQRDPNIGSSGQDGIAIKEQGVRAAEPNIGSSGQDGYAIKEQGVRVTEPNIGSSGQDGIAIDEEGPSTLLDLSAVSDGEGAVAIGDLDADGLPDMADFDTDYDADGIEADDLMVGP